MNDNYFKKTFVNQTHGYLDISLKRELWREVSNDFKGKFIISQTSGNEIEILKIFIPYRNFEIKLTESDTKPLKFEISFSTAKDYELLICFEDTIEKIMKRLGEKEVELGIDKFDNKYIIKSQDPEITKKLLTQEIIDNFINFNIYSLSYTSDIKNQTSSLITVISRTVEEKSILEGLIRLHMNIIDNLKVLLII